MRHLDNWYAQSHPDEDFAETFAVWLKPRSKWRIAVRRLARQEKAGICRRLDDRDLRGAAADHSRESVSTRSAPAQEAANALRGKERPLRRGSELLSTTESCVDCSPTRRTHDGNPSAAPFLRRNRRELRQVVAEWTGQYQYTIDQVLSEMIAPLPGAPAATSAVRQVDQTRRSGDADRTDHELSAKRSPQNRPLRKLRER